MSFRSKLFGSAVGLVLGASAALAAPVTIEFETPTTLVPGEVVDAVYLERLDDDGNIEVVGYAFIDDNGDLFRHDYASGTTSFVDSGITRFFDGDGRIVARNVAGTRAYEFDGTLVATPAGFLPGGSNHSGDLVGAQGSGISAFLANGGTSSVIFPAGGSDLGGDLLDIDNAGNAFGINLAGELYSLNVFDTPSLINSIGGPLSATGFGGDVGGEGLFAFDENGSVWATDNSLVGSLGIGVFGQGHVAGEGFYATSGNQALFFDMALNLVGEATLAGDIFDIRFDTETNTYFSLFEGSLQETSFEFDFSSSDTSAVPVPATLPLLLAGLFGFGVLRRFKVA